MTASSSSSCRWGGPGTSVMSAERQYGERLVVEAVDTANAGDLPIGVESRERYALGPFGQPVTLPPGALVAQHRAQPGAAQREHADRAVPVEPGQRLLTRRVGGRRDRLL